MAKKTTRMSEQIMEDIKSEEIQMHSKTYFRVLNLALVAVSGLFLMLSALLGLVAIRDIRYGDQLGLRNFGSRGYSEFLQTLPWLAIIFGLLTFLIVYTLVKHFNFTYKHKFYVVVGALVFAMAGISLVLASTGIEGAISKTGPFMELRTFTQFSEENTVMGEIVAIDGSKLTIFTKENETVVVELEEGYHGMRAELKVGDMIFATGEWEGEVFKAFGIRGGKRPVPPHMRGTMQTFLK